IIRIRDVKPNSILYRLTTTLLQVGLIALFAGSAWLIYSRLPHQPSTRLKSEAETALQIVLRPSANMNTEALDISIELYPVDIVSVQHEYFTERRAGKRFDDFLSE